MAKKSKFDEKWSKSYFLTCFFEPHLVAVSSLLLLPSIVAMAYGELVQIERESFFSHQPPFWMALHSWKFSVGFYLKRFHNISLSRFKYCRT